MGTAIDEGRILSLVLDEIVCDEETAIFNGASQIRSKSDIFNSYLRRNWYELNLEKVSVNVSETALLKHRKFFNRFFEPFLDNQTGMIGVSLIILGQRESRWIEVIDFVSEFVIPAVVVLGPKRVSELLIDWKICNSLAFTAKFHLLGINLKSPMTVSENIRILSPNRVNFDTRLIDPAKNSMARDTGAIVSVEKQASPVFFKPGDSFADFDLNEIVQSMRDFSDCLSLVLGRYVLISHWWNFDRGLYLFSPDNSVFSTYATPSFQNSIEISPDKIIEANEFRPKLVKLMTENAQFKFGVQRLVKCMQSNEDADKLIELRIALEALFTEEDRHSSDRMSLNFAGFLGENTKERINLHGRFRNFHGEASTVIHGQVKSKFDTDIGYIEELCRVAILKMLIDGKVPDWKKRYQKLIGTEITL